MPLKKKKTVKKKAKQKLLWKCFIYNDKKKLESTRGYYVWEPKKWNQHYGTVQTCSGGFHGSKRLKDAYGYILEDTGAIARVEVKGYCDKTHSKQAWEYMKVLKAWRWTKKDHAAFIAACHRLPRYKLEGWMLDRLKKCRRLF